MKRLIVCCDGTWQKLSSNYPTNVIKITQGIKLLAEDKTPQIVFYDEGIGTGNKVDKLLGGAFGKKIDQNIQDAYRFLCLNLALLIQKKRLIFAEKIAMKVSQMLLDR